MVDKVLLAAKIAAVRDAVRRVRAILPDSLEDFSTNRTAREVVVLNLFVALQEALSLATHWLADEGLDVPSSYRDVFLRLGDRDIVPHKLSARLAAASGFRNLVAHPYGVLDRSRVYRFAAEHTDDLLTFCDSATSSRAARTARDRARYGGDPAATGRPEIDDASRTRAYDVLPHALDKPRQESYLPA